MRLASYLLSSYWTTLVALLFTRSDDNEHTEHGGWVVRGGQAQPVNLQAGFGVHRDAPGMVGCSVQHHPVFNVDQLAAAGQFRNRQMSFAREADLMEAAQLAGYTRYLIATPGRGYHYTRIAYREGEHEPLAAMPDDLAQALSRAFRRRPNPFPATHY